MGMNKNAILEGLRTTGRGDFQDGMNAVEPLYEKVVMSVPSTSKSNTYGWLGQFPMLREWIGQRSIQSMKEFGYQIVNKTYESTVGVKREDLEDDNLGGYKILFKQMGRVVKRQPDLLTFGLLSKGKTTLCYDGQNFFDTDHPVYENADGTGSVTQVSNLLEETDATKKGPMWYLLDGSHEVSALIFQNRRDPEFVSLTTNNSDHVFTNNEYLFGVDCRRNVGFGFWQLALASDKKLNADSLWEGISHMRSFETDGGCKLGIKPTQLVVSPALEKVATRLLERELDANSSNELKGRLELIVADYL